MSPTTHRDVHAAYKALRRGARQHYFSGYLEATSIISTVLRDYTPPFPPAMPPRIAAAAPTASRNALRTDSASSSAAASSLPIDSDRLCGSRESTGSAPPPTRSERSVNAALLRVIASVVDATVAPSPPPPSSLASSFKSAAAAAAERSTSPSTDSARARAVGGRSVTG